MGNLNKPHSLLTVFSTAKAFRGVTAVQQHNAIQSWRRLGSDVEVLLIGDDAGTAEAARQLGIGHIGVVERNTYGTPLISSIFRQASTAATSNLLCYVNADIILMSDFVSAIRRVGTRNFLMCGQRCDLDLAVAVDFNRPNWEDDIRQFAHQRGRLHGVTGLDYFVFQKGLLDEMPAFAIGRTIWDNWIVFHARAQNIPIIDATPAVMAVHQNHDYEHVSGGIQAAWGGPEAANNRALAGDMLYPFTIADATWQLTDHGLARNLAPQRLVRLMQGWVAVELKTHPGARRFIRRVLRAAQ
jgi:hypothetical protein